MFRRYPLIFRGIVFVLIPLICIAGFVYRAYFNKTLTEYSGTISVADISGPVKIIRNGSGIVSIQAEKDLDVYFSMGYVHAQDRLWQLELQRRLSQGRLSEVFGKKLIDQDIWIRTLGLRQAARDSLNHLSSDALESLDAYAKGVNAWISLTDQLPIEFSILDIKPEPWTKEDSLIWVKLFALNLSSSYRNEIQRSIAARYLSDKQFSIFFPDTAPTLVNSIAKESTAEGLESALFGLNNLNAKIERDSQIGNRFTGSNAWVVSGKLTESGKPILANDPHLGLQIPSLWYPVEQLGNRLRVSGMSLVGVPVVIFGRNNHIAWGGTNMMADVQDLFLEQPNPQNSDQYLHKGQWKDFKTRTEVINIKSDFPSSLRASIKPVEIQIRESVNGPIISDVIKGFDQPIAMRWTALEKGDTTYESFFRISHAHNWNSFRGALIHHVAPTLNLMYADNQNNIGFIGVGRIPLRNKGTGAFPVSGADESYSWTGYIDFDEMPQKFNPPQGYLINANNDNTGDDYPHFISYDFASSARAERIEELLQTAISNKQKLNMNFMQEIQADVKDLSSLKLLKLMQGLEAETDRQKKAVQLLKKWSGEADRESLGATIYYGWFRHLKSEIFSDELQGFWNKESQAEYLESVQDIVSADLLSQLITRNSEWCDKIDTEELEDCSKILRLSLSEMIEEMSKFAGNDMQNWRWGQVQSTLYAHIPFSRMKILDKLFERRISNGGAVNTINVSISSYSENDGYQQVFGSSFRQIIQLQSGHSNHRFMNSTGQSGQIASPYYDNMIEDFRDVKYLDFLIEDSSSQVINLIPGES